jgi:hypothetical protein
MLRMRFVYAIVAGLLVIAAGAVVQHYWPELDPIVGQAPAP